MLYTKYNLKMHKHLMMIFSFKHFTLIETCRSQTDRKTDIVSFRAESVKYDTNHEVNMIKYIEQLNYKYDIVKN